MKRLAKLRLNPAVAVLLVLLSFAAAGALMPRVNSGGRSHFIAARTQINAFKMALDVFKDDNGYYPAGADGLNSLVIAPKGATNWKQYLDQVPVDPWGSKYVYEFPGRHNPDGFDLMSKGPDGKEGTQDDITNWQK